MNLQESGEMYLETIFILSKKSKAVRSIDVCGHMGFSKPSVSRAVKILKENGYLIMAEDGLLSLTEKGRQTAERIYERHTLLTDFFKSLGVDGQTASHDACKIEHIISEETFLAIKEHMK